jgi:short-subunit dehydrogenase
MTDFKDKVVWITGASSGIGEALALEFAALGARLVLSARRSGELERVGKLTGLPPLDLMILPFDLADTSNTSGLAAMVVNKFGRIDMLVSNGGYSQRGLALETPIELDRELMEINYFSYVSLTKAVAPYMKREKNGHIVVISSIAGKFGFYLRSSYSAAKHALHGFFESFRLETEKLGIRTLIVCPGKIRTNISFNAVTSTGEKHNQMDPSHENAMSAAEGARQIIKAISAGKEEIYIGGKETWVITIRRFLPGLFKKIIRKQSPY